ARRRRARRLRARPVLRSRRAGAIRHPGARLQLPRSRRERERDRHRPRTRARPSVPLRGRGGPAASARHVRRRAPARDHPRLSRQEDAGGGSCGRAPGRGSLRLHARGGSAPDRGGAEPDAGRRDGLAHAAGRDAPAAGRSRPRRALAGRLEPVASRRGGRPGRCVCRGRAGDRLAHRQPGAGRAPRGAPALERVARVGPRAQARPRCGTGRVVMIPAAAATVAAAVFLTRGPVAESVTQRSAVVSFRTSAPEHAFVALGNGTRVDAGSGIDHVARLTRLRPGARYTYTVETSSGVLAESRFRAAPARAGRFTFAVVGDFGSGTQNETAVASMIESWHPDFVLTVGDNAYPQGSAGLLDRDIFEPYGEVMRGSAWFPALGNHDVKANGGKPELEAFHSLGTERWYRFTWG